MTETSVESPPDPDRDGAVLWPIISPRLARIAGIADNKAGQPGGTFREWPLPEILPEIAAQAGRAVEGYDRLLAPAPPGAAQPWLMQLGVLTAGGNVSVADAKLKAALYEYHLRQPAFCFSDSALRDAAARFKFFPSFAELNEFLNEVAAPYREARNRLAEIGRIKAERDRKTSPSTDEQRAWVTRFLNSAFKRVPKTGGS